MRATRRQRVVDRRRRRLVGMKNISRPARAVPPPSVQRVGRDVRDSEPVPFAVVWKVRRVVASPSGATVRVAGLKEQAGRFLAPAGAEVRAQVSFIVPE